MRTWILTYTALVVLFGCQSDGEDSSDSNGSIGSSGTTGPTGSPETSTVSGSTTASSDSGSEPTGGSPTTTPGSSTATSSGGSTTTGTMTQGSGPGSTTSPCQPGTEGCDCIDGECLGGELQCMEGTCGFPECPDAGEVNCDGDCADLMTDHEHCGECGRGCQRSDSAGDCVAGDCEPTWGNNCVGSSQAPSFPTCDEVCADIGESCAPRACFYGQGTYGIYNECDLDPRGVPANTGSGLCTDPIDWGQVGGRAVRCCCTQS